MDRRPSLSLELRGSLAFLLSGTPSRNVVRSNLRPWCRRVILGHQPEAMGTEWEKATEGRRATVFSGGSQSTKRPVLRKMRLGSSCASPRGRLESRWSFNGEIRFFESYDELNRGRQVTPARTKLESQNFVILKGGRWMAPLF